MTAPVMAAVAVAAAAVALPPNDYRVVLGERIGPYHDYASRKYGGAVAALGSPTTRWSMRGGNYCTVWWRGLGIEMDFVGYQQPCTNAHLRVEGWYGATVHSPRWVVGRGVRVGDSVARLKQLYPAARATRASGSRIWSLVTIPGDSAPITSLSATTSRGRVETIYFWGGGVF